MYLTPPMIAFLLESGTSRWSQEIRMMGATRPRKEVDILAVWIQYTNVTDRQIDRQTGRHRPTASTALTHSTVKFS